MRNFFLCTFVILSFVIGCTKRTQIPQDTVTGYLATHLSASDFADINQASMCENALIIRFSLKSDQNKQIILQKKTDGSITNGKILFIQGRMNKAGYQGTIEVSNLDRSNRLSSVIHNGFILSSHTTALITTAINQISTDRCDDCTIPEVIVSATYKNPYYNVSDPFGWLNLFWLLGGDMPKTEYLPLSGGGSGSTSDASYTLDKEENEKKEKVDPKKFMDCFDQLPDNGTATYTVTISADLPKDGDPYTFFDWTTQFPGHAYIELSKSSPYGSVRQNLGFYPGTSWKVMTGHDIFSKVVDNGFHEYNARYTISVTAVQFEAAINKLNSVSTKGYNISYYNCTDFALDVFNAAGGNLTIPKHAIPAFGVPGGSNTPQGLYQKIEELKNKGVIGTTTTNNKEYTNGSKGPCE